MTEKIYDDTPPRLDLRIYRGSSFGTDWSVDIPDLSDLSGRDGSGPSSLDASGVEVRAHLRYDPNSDEPDAVFDCIKLIPANFTQTVDGEEVSFAGRVRPYLTKAQTASLTERDNGFWSLEVLWGANDSEPILAGEVEISGDVTHTTTGP